MSHKKNKNEGVSAETQQHAIAVAKATQKPNQTKEQTKLIAKGIERGIAEYKKQQKSKSRQLDKKIKQVKKQQADIERDDSIVDELEVVHDDKANRLLPWVLLVLSWVGFIGYMLLTAEG